MNGEEITKLLKATLPKHYNFFLLHKDQIFYHLLKPNNILIFNVDKHWLCLLFHNNGKLFFIDSLGNPFSFYFPNIIIYPKPVQLFSSPIQSKNSSLCGHYVVFVAKLLCSKFNVEQVKNMLSSNNSNINDILLVNFFRYGK